jgi:hypothetical protein
MRHLHLAMRYLWTPHLGRLVLVTMPLLLAVAAPVRAQHQVTTNEEYPITGVYDYTPSVPCGCSGPSDVVNLRGVLHMMVQAQTGPTGVVTMHGNLHGVVGTSPTTGCTYHAVGFARLASNTPGPTPFTGTYEVIPPPSCEHTTVQVTGEVFIDTDGTQNPSFSTFVIGNGSPL